MLITHKSLFLKVRVFLFQKSNKVNFDQILEKSVIEIRRILMLSTHKSFIGKSVASLNAYGLHWTKQVHGARKQPIHR